MADAGAGAALADRVGAIAGVLDVSVAHGQVTARVRADALLPVMQTLRDDPRFAFEQMMDLCGVD